MRAVLPGSAGRFCGNAAQMLLETASSFENRTAVVDGDRTTHYGDLAARTLAIAKALVSHGVEPGERVAIFLQRSADAAAAFFGILATGAVAVTINEALRARQIEHILTHANARVLLTSADILNRLPEPPRTGALTLDVRDIPAAGDMIPVPRIGDDVAHIVYTSGSTGLPKGVTISHANLWAGVEAVVDYLSISSDDRVASLLPFSFDYGLSQLLCCARSGATLVVERSPIPHRVVHALGAQGVTVLAAVPPLWLQLLTVEAFQKASLTSLRMMTNTGGRLPGTAVHRLRQYQPHANLVLMYGLTEAFRSTYLAPDKVDRKPTAIGQAIPGAEVLVLDDQLRPCQPGEVGQLVHRGPTVALGYWNDPAATARVYQPNPLASAGVPEAERVVMSGDMVYQDDEGDLYVVGRADGLIKILGYRVSPDEITDALYASGEITEAVVHAEPDEVRGARIVAYVVLTQDGSVDRLKAFANKELPRHMQPSRFEARSTLSRTSSGKFDAAATANSLP